MTKSGEKLLYEKESYLIRGACFELYRKFGGAFKETIITKALVSELKAKGLNVETQKRIDIIHRNEKIGTYVPDIIIEGKILIELKVKPFLAKEDERQFWYYLRGSNYRLGFLINFSPRKLEIKRRIYEKARNIRVNPRVYPRKSASIMLALFFLLLPLLSSAQEGIVVVPTIIDQKAEARDLLEFSVKITNNTGTKADLYPIVNDISSTSLLDKSTSLARWVQISRGVIELWPGQTEEIPFSINVNLNAKPGKYYAVIIFAQGSTRAEAEAKALKLNQPQVLLNIEVEEHIIERAQIQKFQTEKNFFLNFPVKFLLEIENTGNQEIKPTGSIHIYNRRGEEVGSVNINQAQAAIMPVAKNLFENIWQPEKSFGQYKAVLAAEYGKEEKRDLQDTIYFWVFPWQFLIFFGGALLALIILLSWLIFKKTKFKQ